VPKHNEHFTCVTPVLPVPPQRGHTTDSEDANARKGAIPIIHHHTLDRDFGKQEVRCSERHGLPV
jgi:hypothetical protein